MFSQNSNVSISEVLKKQKKKANASGSDFVTHEIFNVTKKLELQGYVGS